MMKTISVSLFLFFMMVPVVEGNEFRVLDASRFPKAGMFAIANQVLGQLYLLEKGAIGGLSINFGTNGLYYDERHGPNWWSYYFEPVEIGVEDNFWGKFASKEESLAAFRIRRTISRKEAADIVRRHIRIKGEIIEKVESFVRQYFSNFFILGVHYRGTDKSKEAPRVAYKNVFRAILAHLPQDRPYRIFVATDEESFLEAIRTQFPGVVVAIEAERSTSKIGIHFSNDHPYQTGESAIIDSLLLSKTDLLIRTSSNLSLWSTYFNPTLPIVLLNQSYRSHENKEKE